MEGSPLSETAAVGRLSPADADEDDTTPFSAGGYFQQQQQQQQQPLSSSSDGQESPLSDEKMMQLESIGSIREYEVVDGVKHDELGRGAYGVVFKAREKATGELVAIKSVELFNGMITRALLQEIKIGMLSKCPYIVNLMRLVYSNPREFRQSDELMKTLNLQRRKKRLVDRVRDEEQQTDASQSQSQSTQQPKTMCVYMVMELLKYGNVCEYTQFRHVIRRAPLLIREMKYMMQSLLMALEYLHDSRGVMHRDVKTLNILIGAGGEVKLGDLGLALNYVKGSKYNTDRVTLWYRPPELFLGQKDYTPAVDIWSAGVVLLEFLIGDFVFRGKRTDEEMLTAIFMLCGLPHKEWVSDKVPYKPYFEHFSRTYSSLEMMHQCRIKDRCELIIEERFHQEIGALAAGAPHQWVAHEHKKAERMVFSPLTRYNAAAAAAAASMEAEETAETAETAAKGQNRDIEQEYMSEATRKLVRAQERRRRELQRKKEATVVHQEKTYHQWTRIAEQNTSNGLDSPPQQQQTLFLPSQQGKMRERVRKDYANMLDLIQQLLTVDPTERITAGEALGHPFFTSGSQPCTPKEFVGIIKMFAPTGNIQKRSDSDMHAEDQCRKRAPPLAQQPQTVAGSQQASSLPKAAAAAAAAASPPPRRGPTNRLDAICKVGSKTRQRRHGLTGKEIGMAQKSAFYCSQYQRIQDANRARLNVGSVRHIQDAFPSAMKIPGSKRQRVNIS